MSSLYYVFNGLPYSTPSSGNPLTLESGGRSFLIGGIKPIEIAPSRNSTLFVRLHRESIPDEAYTELENLIGTKHSCTLSVESIRITVQIESIFHGINGGTFEHTPIPYPDHSVLTIKATCIS